MSESGTLSHHEQLVPMEAPHVEPRVANQSNEPRRVDDLTLIDGKTFLATNVAGDIAPPGASDVGFFHEDTRFLSHLEFKLDGQRAVVLSSSTERTFCSKIELTTGNMTLRDSFDLSENTIHIRREQLLASDILFDRFTFENFNRCAVEFRVELSFDADFVDVFQVRGLARADHGQYYQPIIEPNGLIFSYRGRDGILRQTSIRMSPAPAETRAGTARWELRLQPLRQTALEVTVTPRVEHKESRARLYHYDAQLAERRKAFHDFDAGSTSITSSNSLLDDVLHTATADFHALRIPFGQEHVIAAGIPWFATIFGRDSILAAYQTLFLNPQLAMDTLRVLARFQATEVDDWRDAQPGKILHESREGEMTRCGEVPFGHYYGSVDSTPLWLVLLSETFNWTADEALVRELLPHAYRALEWIDRYGDLDGDGFVEFLCRSKRGLANQGWKDSWDANMHRDGSLATPPIALCEVQGYVYDAKYRMSLLLRRFGDTNRADQLRREATELARRFEKSFWSAERGYYAMALDAEKKPLEVISSNPGHLLWSRIITRERARAVMQRLMQDDMFSGWGWRTLSQQEQSFNPLSYHRGSVWPHDNSLIAHGMSLNEFRDPAMRILGALFEAALEFRDYRLPELFCGIPRRPHDEPVHYPVSCSPQAWASGAIFLFLSSVLGIRPSAHRKELYIVDPQLPEWLNRLHIRNLKIGHSRVGLDFTRREHRTFCNVVDISGDKLLVNVAFRR
jgi:glycogen debranching enzyme